LRQAQRTCSNDCLRRFADDIKARTDLSEILTRYLGQPRKHGRSRAWLCRFHDDRHPSLQIKTADGRVFVCRACGKTGDVFEFIERSEGVSFIEAVELLSGGEFIPTIRPAPKSDAAKDEADERERIKAARKLCDRAVPIAGTLAERYLRETRSISAPLPSCLKFCAEVPHPIRHLREPCRYVRYLPGLVCEIGDINGNVTGAHVVYLREDQGRVVKAEVDKPKLSIGHLRSGAIKLDEPADEVAICEGVEDGLSVRALAKMPVWASPGTEFLSLIELPERIMAVHVYGQNDEAGRKAATKAAEAHTAQHRRVFIHYPPPEFKDWNDLLRSG
jgi:DNA primase